MLSPALTSSVKIAEFELNKKICVYEVPSQESILILCWEDKECCLYRDPEYETQAPEVFAKVIIEAIEILENNEKGD